MKQAAAVYLVAKRSVARCFLGHESLWPVVSDRQETGEGPDLFRSEEKNCKTMQIIFAQRGFGFSRAHNETGIVSPPYCRK
jgi:hypothetical protein